MPRLAHEVAAQFGVSVEDMRRDTPTDDSNLKDARKAYLDGLADGSVEDARRTGPNVDAGLVAGDVTADPTISSVAGADYDPNVNLSKGETQPAKNADPGNVDPTPGKTKNAS